MRVRRVVGAVGTSALLVLLGAPAWADETPGPDPSPVVADPSSDPANDPNCQLVPGDGDTPTDDGTVTAEPEPTDEPTAEPTLEPTEEPGATGDPEPTLDPEPTEDPDPTGDPEPTLDPDPTGEPEPEPTDGEMWVCQSAAFAGGDGTVEVATPTAALPRTGGPLQPIAVAGLLMIVGGAGTVVLARRRTG